ncbi:MAG TPA: TPM domain-containing protein [Polyangia bacterium]|jgi:uncharacterized protein|nr:TPM domain-containing protein [Polyangia bacterium]
MLMRAVAFAFALTATVATSAVAATPAIPDMPTAFVTDRAGLLSANVVGKLSTRLAAYQTATGHQILVYVDHTTAGIPIEDWATKAFEKWRVGRRGFDDGAIVFLFVDDRRLRIEVGYGLEGQVPDALAGRIINEEIAPRLKAGDGDGAVTAGVESLIAAIGGDPGGAANQGPLPTPIPGWLLVVGGILVALMIGGLVTHPALAAWLLINIASGRGGRGGGFSGGGFGGGGFSGGGGRSGGGGASGSW